MIMIITMESPSPGIPMQSLWNHLTVPRLPKVQSSSPTFWTQRPCPDRRLHGGGCGGFAARCSCVVFVSFWSIQDSSKLKMQMRFKQVMERGNGNGVTPSVSKWLQVWRSWGDHDVNDVVRVLRGFKQTTMSHEVLKCGWWSTKLWGLRMWKTWDFGLMRMWQVHPLSSTWYLYCFGLHSAAFGNRLTKADLKWLLSPPQVMFHPASRLPSGPHIFVTLGQATLWAEVLGIDDLMDVYWNTIEYASGSTWGFLILKLSILMIFAAPRIISDIQEAQTPPNLCYYILGF